MVGADDGGTSRPVWCSGPSSDACMEIEEVATTPRLPGRDGDGGEGAALVVARGLVPDGFVSPARGEHHMLGFDILVREGCRRDSDELAEQLPAEHTVVSRR